MECILVSEIYHKYLQQGSNEKNNHNWSLEEMGSLFDSVKLEWESVLIFFFFFIKESVLILVVKKKDKKIKGGYATSQFVVNSMPVYRLGDITIHQDVVNNMPTLMAMFS